MAENAARALSNPSVLEDRSLDITLPEKRLLVAMIFSQNSICSKLIDFLETINEKLTNPFYEIGIEHYKKIKGNDYNDFKPDKLDMQHIQQAYDNFSIAANGGHVEAQCKLGLIYLNCGNAFSLTEQSDMPYPKIKEAFNMLNKAAEQGHADNQYNLGNFYFYGPDMYGKYACITEDNKKAAEFYTKAADQGHELAMDELYRMALWGPWETPVEDFVDLILKYPILLDEYFDNLLSDYPTILVDFPQLTEKYPQLKEQYPDSCSNEQAASHTPSS